MRMRISDVRVYANNLIDNGYSDNGQRIFLHSICEYAVIAATEENMPRDVESVNQFLIDFFNNALDISSL